MFEPAYAFAEKRILAREAARRGARLAARIEADGAAVGALDEIADRMGDASVASFDLFDTLIQRRGLSPEAMDRKVAGFARHISGARAGEAIWAAKHMIGPRMKAKMIAAGEGDEPLLRDIYREALEGAGVDHAAAMATDLVAFETAVEARGIRAAPGAEALLARLKEDGRKVIAVSDMYLGGAEVRRILKAAGLLDYFEEVFVSADLKWTKRGGRIFEIVRNRLGVDASDIVHSGDRMDSDVTPARAAGWNAIHFVDRAGVGETEAARIKESHIPSPLLRRQRVDVALGLGAPSYETAEDIAARLFGPACGLLAMSALGRARENGADRIYHLTRDATVIGEVITATRSAHPFWAADGMEVRELAISRALGARLQVRGINDLWRLSHLAPYLAGAPFNAECIRRAFGVGDEAFTEATRTASGAELTERLRDEAHGAPMLQALKAGRASVEDYLKAERVFDPAPAVAVDIGYSGTFAAQLSEVFHAEDGGARHLDFLFLLTSRYFKGNLRKMHPSVRIHPGVAMDHRHRSTRWPSWNFAWAEPFLVDPDRGKLRGYENGAPVFEATPFDDATRAHHRAIREAIVAGAMRFIDDFHGAPGDLEEAGAIIQRRFARFAGRPTGAEVRAVRSLAHQAGQVALDARDPTRRINPLFLWRELPSLKLGDHWVQGSLKRSGLGLINRIMADPPEAERREDPRWPMV